MFNGTTNKNLVPKPTNETKERTKSGQGNKRTSAARAGGTGQAEATTTRETTETRTTASLIITSPTPPRSDENGIG